jgi:hypothetical protein
MSLGDLRSILRLHGSIESKIAKVRELNAEIEKANQAAAQYLSYLYLIQRLLYADPIVLGVVVAITAGEVIGSALMPAPTSTHESFGEGKP